MRSLLASPASCVTMPHPIAHALVVKYRCAICASQEVPRANAKCNRIPISLLYKLVRQITTQSLLF